MRTPLLDLARPGFHRLCRAYFGLELAGTDNIPVSGPIIITPNHQTYADPALVTRAAQHRDALGARMSAAQLARVTELITLCNGSDVNRCGEIIEGRVDLDNDLSLDYEDDREVFHVRKGLIGNNRCFQQIEVEMKFNSSRELIEQNSQGGTFVE